MVPLTRRPGGLQAFKQLYPPQWPGREPEQQSHEGYEWLYVLSGRLRLLLGEHDILLKPGEVAEFDTHVPHAFATGRRAGRGALPVRPPGRTAARPGARRPGGELSGSQALRPRRQVPGRAGSREPR